MQEIGINSSVLGEILAGKKTVETRLAKERFLSFKVGDKISIREDIWQAGEIIRSIPDKAQIEITGIERFDTFRELLQAVGYEKVRPSANSIEDAIKAYEQYYSIDEEKRFGVIAFFIKLISNN